MQPVHKILVIRLSSLGDIVLSFPLLKKLKEKFPGSETHFLTKRDYEEILMLNPNIDKILLFDGMLGNMRKQIREQNYDIIIDIHKNLKSIYLSLRNGKRVLRYLKENTKKFLLVRFKINLFKQIFPVYKKYLFAIKNFLNDDDLSFSVTELRFDKTRLIENNYIVISPSSRHFTKTYPADKFVKYINAINDTKKSNNEKSLKIVLTGDDSEKDLVICEYIESKCSSIINLCGKLSIEELSSVLFHSEFVICNDSAVLHLSEALGKKVVGIFGSTVKEFGFFPQLRISEVREVKNLECRPCTHIGRENCPRGHFKCMNDIQFISL